MKNIRSSLKETLIYNFFGGIAWGLGLTVGVALIGFILSKVASSLGGLPLVGSFLAEVVKATIAALNKRPTTLRSGFLPFQTEVCLA